LLKNEKVNTMLQTGEFTVETVDNLISESNLIIESLDNMSVRSGKSANKKPSSSYNRLKPETNGYNVSFFNTEEKQEEEILRNSGFSKRLKSPRRDMVSTDRKQEPERREHCEQAEQIGTEEALNNRDQLNILNNSTPNLRIIVEPPEETPETADKNQAVVKDVELEKLVAFNMGTTANIALIKNKTFYLANVGDSRAVLYKDGGKPMRLNEEHKPNLVSEQTRISKSGFNVVGGRIDGKLNLTRAIGDFMFKKNHDLKRHEQAVTVYPEIKKLKITKEMEFIVIACDGVWDCVDDDKLGEYIWKGLNEQKKITEIISNLFDQILSKNAKSNIGTDNMSCIIIQFCHF